MKVVANNQCGCNEPDQVHTDPVFHHMQHFSAATHI